MRRGSYDNFHVGRGGEGNVHREKEKEKGGGGLLKKVEGLFGGKGGKKDEGE